VAATVVLPVMALQERWTSTTEEMIPSRVDQQGGAYKRKHRTFEWSAVPHTVQRYASALPWRRCAGGPLRCMFEERATDGIETAVERRCARTARPCIGNEIDRYHKALISQLSIYCYYCGSLHNNLVHWTTPVRALITTSKHTSPATSLAIL